ncbi:hypothetical protein ABK040_012596 [Willaertia magna]
MSSLSEQLKLPNNNNNIININLRTSYNSLNNNNINNNNNRRSLSLSRASLNSSRSSTYSVNKRPSSVPKPVKYHPSHTIPSDLPLYTPGPGQYNANYNVVLPRSSITAIPKASRFKDDNFSLNTSRSNSSNAVTSPKSSTKRSASSPGFEYTPKFEFVKKKEPAYIIGKEKRRDLVAEKKASLTPGPGQYGVPEKPTKRQPTPSFGKSRRKSLGGTTETPGPMYEVTDVSLSKVKRTPSFSFPKSKTFYKKSITPAPNQYTPNFNLTKKNNASTIFGKTPREGSKTNETPGPGQYDVLSASKTIVTKQTPPSFSFPKSPRKSLSNGESPGPLYNVNNSMLSKVGASFGKSKRFISNLSSTNNNNNIGPGQYTPNFTVSSSYKAAPRTVLYLTG